MNPSINRNGVATPSRHTDEALHEQQEWLRVTLSSIGDGVITSDPAGRVTYLNPVAQILTGWTQADAEGVPLETVFRIVSELNHQTVENPAVRALRDGFVVGLANHTLLIAKDGTERPIEDSASPIRSAMGEIVGVVLIFRDATERRRAEQAAQDAQDFADNIIATIREPFLVLDQNLRIVTANRSFTQNFHITLEATRGQLIYDLGNRQWDIPKLRTLLEEVLPQNHSFDDFEVVHDFPNIGRKVMLLNARRIRKPGNHSELILLAIEDITKRRCVDEALHESDELNRSIIASSPDCIKILDLDGNLLSIECGVDLLGIDDIEPYLNTSWIDFWNGDDRLAARAAVESAREKAGAVGNFVGFFKTLRDEPKWWDVTLSPILNAAGRPVQLLAVSRDVTQRTRDVEALRENQVRMSFAADTVRLTYVEVNLATGAAKVAENFADVMGYSITHEQTANFHVGSELLLDHIAPADRSSVHVALQQFLGGKTVGSIEYRVIGDDRIERWIESRWSIESDPDGKPLKTFAINLDITERKRAEEAVRESQRFLRSSLDALSSHIAVLDDTGTILEVNQAWQRFADENHFAGANYGIGSSYLLPEAPTAADECNLVTSSVGIRDVIAGRRADFELEYPCHSPTEQRWYQMRVTRFDSPGPIRVVVVHDNITERKLAESQLQKNHDTFSQLIENAPFGLYVVDSEFKLRQVSSASKKIFQNIHPLIGRDFDKVLRLVWAEPFVGEAIGRFRHTLATGEPYAAPNTTELRYASINVESYDWKIERITLPDGQFGVVCYFYDISERINSELALRASEEQYRNLFNSMDEGYCILEMIFDEQEKPIDWRFLEVNPSFEKQTGLHNIVGKRMRSLVPDHETYWFETYGNVVRTGEPVRFVNQAKGLDNNWFDLYAFRVGEAGSRKVAVLFTNISERKKYEEAIRQSERSLKFILASMPQMITTAKPNGELDSYNPQWLEYTGLPVEQMRGWGWKEIIHPDDLNETVRLWTQSVATGETYHRQERFRRADGEYRWHLSRAVPMKDVDGQVVMWIGSNTDVHDIKEIENQLQEQTQALADLHRRKDEFLAMLSHELRSPLAPISNAVHLLRMQSHEEPLQRQARSVIERQVGQLSRLVDDLMEVSRITTGRVHLRQERVVVGGIVERAVETAHPMMEHRKHQLTVTVPPEPIWLFADSGRLEQVVVNLLTNAAKYTEVGGQVWITVEPANSLGQCELRVRDTGVGIAPGLLPQVFDLFTQAERSLDRSQGGLGIGLALVQRLVEMHGGTVEVTSTLGQGSEFIVRLPLLKEDGKMRKLETDSAASTAVAKSSLKVLVVDDNEDSAESLAMLLQVCGHDVRLAHDGLRALDEASDYQPDVVLLDIGLPKMDGYEVAVKLRQQPTHQTCVLVALTGYGQESDRQRSLDAGFNHHLVKPADFTKLQQILAEASQRK